MSLSPVRRHVLIGATLFVSVGGALLGASLKSDQQKREATQKAIEITPEQQIAMLEDRKTRLAGQKEMLQKKIDGAKERIEKKRGLERERERFETGR